MNKVSLDATAREQLERARVESSGRSSTTVFGGHEYVLRQVVEDAVIVLTAAKAR